MTAKSKIVLIISGIFLFIGGWVFFIMSIMGDAKDGTSDIIKSPDLDSTSNSIDENAEDSKDELGDVNSNDNEGVSENTDININSDTQNSQTSTGETQDSVDKTPYSLKILSYSGILDSKAQKLFNFKLKKHSGGTLEFKDYNDLKEYNKDIIYKLATKTADFDMAIIPSYWYDDITKDIETVGDLSFKIAAPGLNIASIFDYNFESYVKNNEVRAIPFGIDPIIGYANNKNNDVSTDQTFKSWQDTIIKNPNRIKEDGTISNMPIFLGYDKEYLDYIKDNDSLFPIFDYIFKYYVLKHSDNGIKLMKDLGQNMIHKTFDLKLFKKNLLKYKKYNFCKKNIKLCLILGGDSLIVYDWMSNGSFYKDNGLEIFRKFKLRPSQIKNTTLALGSSSNEYPTRGRIIILNPKIDQQKFIRFLQSYITMGADNQLPFYKNLISPFVGIQINSKFDFLSKYLGRFILLEKFGVNFKENLTKKELNYLNGNINVEALFN